RFGLRISARHRTLIRNTFLNLIVSILTIPCFNRQWTLCPLLRVQIKGRAPTVVDGARRLIVFANAHRSGVTSEKGTFDESLSSEDRARRDVVSAPVGETARGGLHLRRRRIDHIFQSARGRIVGAHAKTERRRGPILRLVQALFV